MEFKFRVTGCQMLLTPEHGFELHCGLTMQEEPAFLELKSGYRWKDATYSIQIFPPATSPRKDDEFEDNRIGEFSPLLLGKAQRSAYKAWMHVPSDQFNLLYAEPGKRKEKVDLQLCFNEDRATATASGTYDDFSLQMVKVKIPVLTYRIWVELMAYRKDEEEVE